MQAEQYPRPRALLNSFDERTEDEKQSVFLAEYLETGTLSRASKKSMVPLSRVYKWRMLDKNFEAAFQEIVLMQCAQMEDEAYRRAVKGNVRPVYQSGKLVGRLREYSDILLMFLMKKKMPEVYGDQDKDKDKKHGSDDGTVLILPPNGRDFRIQSKGEMPIQSNNASHEDAQLANEE